jgi:hypothetical protein
VSTEMIIQTIRGALEMIQEVIVALEVGMKAIV